MILRPWRDADLAPFATLNADPRVMEHFPKTLDRAESDAAAARIRDHFDQNGFGLWSVEVPGVAPFIGFVGLNIPKIETHFTPCLEIGWRLACEFWGHGYAAEAAQAAIDYAFEVLGREEVVSYTVPANARSRKVMERIGMVHCPQEDFAHPILPAGHPLSRHVLYRLPKALWAAAKERR
ncbi:MAG: GNAT family N-acetyltransferase [Planctomycetia bacterium]|nr:GNAT family N-acetyltransferase [Planctomycetia bacterium]